VFSDRRRPKPESNFTGPGKIFLILNALTLFYLFPWQSLSNGPVGSVCVIEYASGGGDSISRRRYTVALERMLGIEESGRGGGTGEGGGGDKISKFDPGEIISRYSAVELRSEGQPSQTGSFRALANSMGNQRERGSIGGWEGGGDLGSFEGGSSEMNRQAHQRIMEIQSHNDAASDQIRFASASTHKYTVVYQIWCECVRE
jgi:hypothetical protein